MRRSVSLLLAICLCLCLAVPAAAEASGKIILPFCTSHSSGIGSSDDDLHALAPDTDWLEGSRFPAGTTREEIAAWLDERGIKAAPQVGTFAFERKTVMQGD